MSRFLRRVLVALLLGVVVYGALVIYSGFAQVSASLRGFDWRMFAAALGLASLNYGLRFAKWEYYLARLEVRGVPKLESLLVYLSGFVLTVTPGKVGEVFKSAVLSETHQVPVARTAPIVIAERLTDVLGVIVIILLGSIGFAGGLKWALIGLGLVSVLLVLILWRAPVTWLIARLEARGGRLAALAPRLREAMDSLRVVASPGALLLPTALSIVGWGGEGFALWLLLQGFGMDVSVTLSLFFFSVATLAGAVVPVPGGLGVADTLIQEQLVQLGGVDAGSATAAMLLIRFATLWWAVLVGFLALALLKRRFPHLLRAPLPGER
ncbi:MAG: flippase-like domain-containing protein [Polyangiaceae bacterium]|nr:flippase-like domain-containing protein [Polyangiaceae bacterium]MCW5790824.1 flippase-like domain-containing protein [Polyangiaceae bacterium]